jgi:hypothetical protein
MAASNKNRDGWKTGSLAELPACPPFPAFTDFERQALDSIAPIFGDREEAFRAQIANAEVVDRINTVVGFYTRVRVDRAKCSPVPIHLGGAHFDVEGVELGLHIILWDTDGDGYLEQIEGVGVVSDLLKDVDLASLNMVRMTLLG